jgi:hypothetical protein
MGWTWTWDADGGPAPGEVPVPGPDATISHNTIRVEVLNTNPVITSKIKAYAPLDLKIRMSGTKTHEATMTLYETHGGTTTERSVSVTRDPGSPDIGVLGNVQLMMTKDFKYKVVIVVDPQGGGGSNPTWIFDMVFPDGKFKEFKHTFNDEHGWTWVIDNDELKKAVLGHDIVFEASADDIGSDDLAFVWNFGDQTPFGVNLYANVDQGTAVEGVSDEATAVFDQLPNRDPDFDRPANDERSPAHNPMHVDDSISHIFDENQPYYYYVTLLVMDDDVCDYPEKAEGFMNDGGYDMEFVEISLG